MHIAHIYGCIGWHCYFCMIWANIFFVCRPKTSPTALVFSWLPPCHCAPSFGHMDGFRLFYIRFFRLEEYVRSKTSWTCERSIERSSIDRWVSEKKYCSSIDVCICIYIFFNFGWLIVDLWLLWVYKEHIETTFSLCISPHDSNDAMFLQKYETDLFLLAVDN